MRYPIPNIILVGYGRSQIMMHSCLECKQRFIPYQDDECFCQDHQTYPIPDENYSLVKHRGKVIGWCIEIESVIDKRSRYNFNKVLKRDRYQCQYCGYKPGIVPEFYPLHVDHVIPFSKKGSNALTNLRTACQVCNQLAWSHLFDNFLDKKAFILERRVEKGHRRTWFKYVSEFYVNIGMPQPVYQ